KLNNVRDEDESMIVPQDRGNRKMAIRISEKLSNFCPRTTQNSLPVTPPQSTAYRLIPHYSKLMTIRFPLAYHFKQQNSGGHRNIHRIDLSGHWNTDILRGRFTPFPTQPFSFRADHDGRGSGLVVCRSRV